MYKEHLLLTNDANMDRLDESIELLKHTSAMVKLFSDKRVIFDAKDVRLEGLSAALDYFNTWKDQIGSPQAKNQFFSEKLWFDLQSMILGFHTTVEVKLSRFPGSVIKPAIINQDLVENHFSQLRAANGQNENPTYLLTQSTRNSVIFGQTTVSRKGNTGTSKNASFSELPKEHIFSRKQVRCRKQFVMY